MFSGTIRKLLMYWLASKWSDVNNLMSWLMCPVSAVCLEVVQCFLCHNSETAIGYWRHCCLSAFLVKKCQDTTYRSSIQSIWCTTFLPCCPLVWAMYWNSGHLTLWSISLLSAQTWSGSMYEKVVQESCLISLWWQLLNRNSQEYMLAFNKAGSI